MVIKGILIIIYLFIGFMFHIMTRPDESPKKWLRIVEYILDVCFWPIILTVFEIQSYRQRNGDNS